LALTTEDKLILSAILVILMILVLYYELRVLRGKAKGVRAVNQRKDEAHNAVLTTRSVIDVVERGGADVSDARALFNRARDAMARGDFDGATDLCESARLELMKCRQPVERKVRKQAVPTAGTDDLERLAEEIVKSDRRPSHADSYKGTKLPVDENSGQLGAKFEITAARGEVGAAAGQGKDISKAKSLIKMAESEFEAANYPKALSLAVKARKELGAASAEDTIPLRVAPRVPVAGECVEDVAVMSEDQATGLKCESCSSMILPDDVFCGHCGAPAVEERACPKCGRRSDQNDKFCRKCGTTL
jgi:hypothetical protein